MIYLALIFMPPVYFLTRKWWAGFIVNSIIYGVACLCALSITGFGLPRSFGCWLSLTP
jgi:hypothetical protein